MPGFIVEIAKDKLLGNFGSSRMERRVTGKMSDNKHYSVERYTINKFLNDKAFYEDNDFVVLTEGVILNSLSLQKKYLGTEKSSAEKMALTVIKMYQEDGEKFFEDFRGSFSGFFYDKKHDLCLIYTNHVGDKQVFYTQTEHGFAFVSEETWLTDYLKNNHLTYSLDMDGVYCLLTYGYMLESHTLINEINKLNAGKYAKIKNNVLEIKDYYTLDNTPNENETEDEIIDNLDCLFKNAIKLEYEKDKEYGYKHFATLSGGLDSRMNVWVSHNMGYTNQLNWTMCQCDYLDEKIAKDIARDLKHDWLFKSLDNGNFLCDIVDEMVDFQFGNVFFTGCAHGRSSLKLINFDEYGLEHTGQLGDAVLGTYLSKNMNNKNYVGVGACSSTLKLINRIANIELKYKYDNTELFKFYNRGFTGILQGNLIPQEYTEVVSPFLDIEFLNYGLHIPEKYRKGELIYQKWILKKYPNAAKYKWEKINARIDEKWINILGRRILLKRLPKILFNKFFPFTRNKVLKRASSCMNPEEYWYKTNLSLKKSWDDYYETNIKNISINYNFLKEDLQSLYNGDVTDKAYVLTLLSAYKKYFN